MTDFLTFAGVRASDTPRADGYLQMSETWPT
jgi:hypothetical protein